MDIKPDFPAVSLLNQREFDRERERERGRDRERERKKSVYVL